MDSSLNSDQNPESCKNNFPESPPEFRSSYRGYFAARKNGRNRKVYSYIEHPSRFLEYPLAVAGQLSVDKSVDVVEFQRLKDLSDTAVAEVLAKEFGIVYVTAITRDGCSGCMEQKPLFRELAHKMQSDLGGRVHFANVHVRYTEDDRAESWKSKKIFRHAAYPTYLVHVRSKNGVLEVYRAIYPTMEELEKQARESLDLAKFYKDAS